MLVDDVPDSFFTNYTVGDDIDSASDFDPETEADDVDNIDTNHNLSSLYALRAHTRKCRYLNNSRRCNADKNEDENDDNDIIDPNDNEAPYIKKINVQNRGQKGYIDTNDEIQITFNETIDPASINPELEADSYYNSLDDDITGAISVFSDGIITVNDIISFDLGKVDAAGQFAVKLSLNLNATILTVTIISGNEIKINDEDFEDAKQIGGTVKDKSGNTMETDSDIGEPDGSFGGVNINDGVEPYITSIKVYNDGKDDFIDTDDKIKITFSEEIDADSIHNSLEKDSSVSGVESDETGGIILSSNGILTITDIARFYVGDVDDSELYDVSLALNSTGKILTITLEDGDDVAIENEDLDDAEQIGDVIEDKDGNEMDDDPNISDPIGSFSGESAGSELYISYIKAYDDGFAGYVDVDDRIVITFSQAIHSSSMDGVNNVEFGETGGVYINNDGLLTVTDIVSFDIGTVQSSGEFEVGLSMDSNNKILTIVLTDGDPIKIISENFSDTTQFGGFIQDENQEITMETENIDIPNGTFGGDSIDSPPYITAIEVENGNNSNYIDTGDKITLTFNEALDPDSINNELELDDYVRDVDDDDTGGVIISDNGTLTISDIAEFYVGDVDDDSEFEVKLSLNSIGNVLTITLQDGTSVEINYEDLDEAEQIGGTIEDEDGNKMEDDPRIDDPIGSF
jgi:uncharacterized protein with GYD domain